MLHTEKDVSTVHLNDCSKVFSHCWTATFHLLQDVQLFLPKVKECSIQDSKFAQLYIFKTALSLSAYKSTVWRLKMIQLGLFTHQRGKLIWWSICLNVLVTKAFFFTSLPWPTPTAAQGGWGGEQGKGVGENSMLINRKRKKVHWWENNPIRLV